jgi:hypothetical protein
VSGKGNRLEHETHSSVFFFNTDNSALVSCNTFLQSLARSPIMRSVSSRRSAMTFWVVSVRDEGKTRLGDERRRRTDGPVEDTFHHAVLARDGDLINQAVSIPQGMRTKNMPSSMFGTAPREGRQRSVVRRTSDLQHRSHVSRVSQSRAIALTVPLCHGISFDHDFAERSQPFPQLAPCFAALFPEYAGMLRAGHFRIFVVIDQNERRTPEKCTLMERQTVSRRSVNGEGTMRLNV